MNTMTKHTVMFMTRTFFSAECGDETDRHGLQRGSPHSHRLHYDVMWNPGYFYRTGRYLRSYFNRNMSVAEQRVQR